MGKYEPLSSYLKDLPDDSWDASFPEIERILGFGLPPSAREHRAWWANQYRGNHSQAQGWISAGWETREIDQRRGRVRFERQRGGGRSNRTIDAHRMWLRAREVTGITDRGELERAAINALLEREAINALIGMGGSSPDATAAPRERPFR